MKNVVQTRSTEEHTCPCVAVSVGGRDRTRQSSEVRRFLAGVWTDKR